MQEQAAPVFFIRFLWGAIVCFFSNLTVKQELAGVLVSFEPFRLLFTSIALSILFVCMVVFCVNFVRKKSNRDVLDHKSISAKIASLCLVPMRDIIPAFVFMSGFMAASYIKHNSLESLCYVLLYAFGAKIMNDLYERGSRSSVD